MPNNQRTLLSRYMTGQQINLYQNQAQVQNNMLKRELDKVSSKKENIKMENENVEKKVVKKAKKADPVDVGGIALPDIPMPDTDNVESDIVNDECDAAFKFAFVGVGQAGNRLVETFHKIGYRRVCAINTTNQDLKKIDIPEANKLVMDVGDGGAGKNPEKGLKAIRRYYEDVYDLMRRSWGKDFERIIICSGMGGGTGTGSTSTLIKIAHDIAETFKLENGFTTKESKTENRAMPSNPISVSDPAVGCLISMPMTSEGQKVNANAAEALEELFEKVGKGGKLSARSISPLIIVDNERIQKIYPNLPVTKFWGVANSSISSLFHLFNNIATKESEFTTFDRADFADVLTGGVITLGATPIVKFDSPTDISQAIRDNLKKNILVSNADLSQAKKAACIFIAHPEVLDQIPQGYLEHGFDMLTRIMAEGSVVHRGIYQGNVVDKSGQPGLVVYTMISELGKPEERMQEIYRYAGKK